MPTFKLDGRRSPSSRATRSSARRIAQGIEIPHYCWHPGLCVAANCRMCLVEVAPPPGPPGDDARLLALGRGEERLRRRAEAEAPARLPAGGAPRAWRSSADSSEHVARGARRACRSSCSSTTRSTARSAIRPASASCRTTGSSTRRTQKRMRDEPVHKPKAVRLRPDHRLRRRALHRVHALRALLRRGREGSACSTCASAAT